MNLIYKKGNDQEALNALNIAIAKDPKNASNYYNAGVLYSRIANPVDANGKPKTKPSNFTELNTKAIESYKKANIKKRSKKKIMSKNTDSIIRHILD